jgi:aryl-alcohol dehydrogenase-like predicted oxidoreductase
MKYYLLGKSVLRVSELALGAMSFGSEWGWGADVDEARKMLDLFIDRGGNFVDTANFYTNGASEKMLGEFLGEKRPQIVLSTKYTFSTHPGDPNAGGNHRKSMVRSVETSLQRLVSPDREGSPLQHSQDDPGWHGPEVGQLDFECDESPLGDVLVKQYRR